MISGRWDWGPLNPATVRDIVTTSEVKAVKIPRREDDVMKKRLFVFSTVMAITALSALPVAADPPNMVVEVIPGEWVVDNPCTEAYGPILFEGTVTRREIVQGQRRITAISHEITDPSPWSGRGTDTGVELDQGETVLAQIMVSNSETDQKFRFFARGHFNANTGDWNTGDSPLFGSACVRP